MVPLEAVFDGRMSWGEAFDLTMVLVTDPSSRVGAALAGWQYPLSVEAMALGAQPKKVPQVGNQERVMAALRAAGHGRDDEVADVIQIRPA